MCQQPWLHTELSFCCASEHMILPGENKCFHNVFARLFVDLISIFKEHACKKPNFWGAGNFFDYLPLTAMAPFTPKVARRTNSRKFSSGSFQVQGGEQSIGTFCSARIALASFNYLLRPTCIFLFTAAFFCFFFHTNVPSIPVLVFTGLCLAPPDGINTCAFAFSPRASQWACLLLNSAT